MALLAEAKPDRPRYANVEFYAGVVMEICGIPRDMFTPTFAVSRVVGWVANVLEQATERRIIRPAAHYVGPPAPQPVPVLAARPANVRHARNVPVRPVCFRPQSEVGEWQLGRPSAPTWTP